MLSHAWISGQCSRVGGEQDCSASTVAHLPGGRKEMPPHLTFLKHLMEWGTLWTPVTATTYTLLSHAGCIVTAASQFEL